MSSQRRTPLVLVVTSLMLMATAYAWRIPLLLTRAFDPDEFEHLHAGWDVHQGLLPYRDFFEHHMPAIQYLLSWLLGAFDVTGNSADAIRAVFVARTLMWIFAGCGVLLTMAIGAELEGAAVGWISGALLSTSVVFIGRTLEIRPDVPSLAFWLAFLYGLLRAMAPGADPVVSRRQFLGAGLCLGVALVFNQKLLLAGPGLAVFCLWYLSSRETLLKPRLLNILTFAVAVSAPLVALGAFFWAHGALGDLMRGALLDNLGWVRELSAGATIHWLLLRDPLFSGLSAAGLVHGVLDLRREPSGRLAAVILPVLSLLAGLFITPAPYPQYLLPLLPLLAVLSARLVWIGLASRSLISDAVESRPVYWFVILCGAVTTLVALFVARPYFHDAFVYPAFGVAALLAVAWLAARRLPGWAVALLLVGCSVYSFQQLRWMQGLSNAEALAEMRYVHDVTAPTDAVLDGFTGVAWFRPSSSFYSFLHPGIRARLSAADVDALVARLNACATRPKLVILDRDLREVSVLLAPAVARDYEPSPFSTIWVRHDPCTP